MKNYTVNVGLDGSLKTIHVSLAIAGRNGEVRRFGDIPYDLGAVGKLPGIHTRHLVGGSFFDAHLTGG